MAEGCPDTAPPTAKGPVTDRGLLVLRDDSAFYASADGHRAAAVPQVGTHLMAASLRVVVETAHPLPGPVQLPVRFVEHHLVPEHDGKVPVWWDCYDGPGPVVVLHAALGSSPASGLLRQMIRLCVADGWECYGTEGSVLRDYGLEARRDLGL
ncbi:hypothetical protein ACH4VM_29430 [Streptomyces sp. NPDC020792]|uniref:hypothetical protein n=1 Tax=Streptomyces sp. NPDC020792 TaxID=3365089 RepID=UPI0037B63B80